MQHETDVAVGFFLIIDGWIIIFLNMFLMLQMMIFNVAYVSFSMLQTLILNVAHMDRPMGIFRPGANKPV